MLGEEKPPYIQNAPQEDEEDDPNEILSQNRNMSEDQIHPNFIDQGDPMEQIPIQQPLNQSSNYINQSPQDDILKKSSLDDINDYQNNNIQNITQPLVQEEIGQPIIQTKVLPVQYNNINENRNISNSYSFSNYQMRNNSLILSGMNQNQNNLYATVIPLNGEPLISSERENYGNNNNLIYGETQAIDNNIYQNTTDQIISQIPQYDNIGQNLIFSSPIPESHNLNIDYNFSNNINNLYHTYNPSNINNNLIQGNAKVVHIDENLMKNPQMAKYVEESERHVNNYLSKIGESDLNNNNNINNNNVSYNNINNNNISLNKRSFNGSINKSINNSVNNINKSINRINNRSLNNINNSQLKSMNNKNNNSKFMNENSNRLRGSKIKLSHNSNLSNRIEFNPNDCTELNDFSPESWQNFYNKNDPFFTSLDNSNINIIHDQILKNPEKNEVYSGDINNEEQKHGFGKLITPTFVRIGNWKNDKFHGWGREVRNDGKIFEGKFVNDILNGKGILKDGGIFYIGDFKRYNKHGKGEIFTSSYHYIGNFNNDNMDGKGRIEIYDEGIYEGNFNNGKMDGIGLFKFKNGDFYEGEMKGGKMDGIGQLTLANGTIYEGNFQDGEFIEKEINARKMYTYKDNYH